MWRRFSWIGALLHQIHNLLYHLVQHWRKDEIFAKVLLIWKAFSTWWQDGIRRDGTGWGDTPIHCESAIACIIYYLYIYWTNQIYWLRQYYGNGVFVNFISWHKLTFQICIYIHISHFQTKNEKENKTEKGKKKRKRI